MVSRANKRWAGLKLKVISQADKRRLQEYAKIFAGSFVCSFLICMVIGWLKAREDGSVFENHETLLVYVAGDMDIEKQGDKFIFSYDCKENGHKFVYSVDNASLSVFSPMSGTPRNAERVYQSLATRNSLQLGQLIISSSLLAAENKIIASRYGTDKGKGVVAALGALAGGISGYFLGYYLGQPDLSCESQAVTSLLQDSANWSLLKRVAWKRVLAEPFGPTDPERPVAGAWSDSEEYIALKHLVTRVSVVNFDLSSREFAEAERIAARINGHRDGASNAEKLGRIQLILGGEFLGTSVYDFMGSDYRFIDSADRLMGSDFDPSLDDLLDSLDESTDDKIAPNKAPAPDG